MEIDQSQIILIIISVLATGFIGGAISIFLPRAIARPKIKVLGHDFHRSFNSLRISVMNTGSVSAKNAIAKITIRPITEGSILGSKFEMQYERDKIQGNWRQYGDWRRSKDAWLSDEDWKIGIDDELVFWASQPNPYMLDLYPKIEERIIIGYSEGPWIDIASETIRRKRCRLSLAEGRQYHCELRVGSENSNPSRPYRFKIILGSDGVAAFERIMFRIPWIVK